MKNMLRARVMAALFVAASSTTAWAHSPLSASSPSDGERLAAPPSTISLSFARPARLVKVDLVPDGGNRVSLRIPSREMVRETSLPVAVPGSGRYEVHWRALGDDGHAMSGRFAFTVDAR